MKERRQFVRWNVAVAVRYKDPDRETTLVSKVKDISNGGLSIYLPQRLDYDALLDMKVDMPESIGPIRVTGKVVWQEGSVDYENNNILAGVKFANISYSDRDKIYEYVCKFQREELTRRWWSSVESDKKS